MVNDRVKELQSGHVMFARIPLTVGKLVNGRSELWSPVSAVKLKIGGYRLRTEAYTAHVNFLNLMRTAKVRFSGEACELISKLCKFSKETSLFFFFFSPFLFILSFFLSFSFLQNKENQVNRIALNGYEDGRNVRNRIGKQGLFNIQNSN